MNAIGLRIDNLWDELNDLREGADPDTFKLYHMLGVIHGLKEAEDECNRLSDELKNSDHAFAMLKDGHARQDGEFIDLQAKMEDAYAQISYIKEAYRED